MARDEDLTRGAERVSADVLSATGSVLRFRVDDADLGAPDPTGTVHVVVIAHGSVPRLADSSLVSDEDEPRPIIWIELDGETVGSAGATLPDTEELLALFADKVQDEVIEARWDAGLSPAAWPECPLHHSHPLNAEVRDGVAVWECPVESSTRYPIGSLP